MIIAPGVYPSLSMADYLALPCASASLIKAIVNECPRAAWFESWLNPDHERDDTKASDAGTIAHAIILEGSTDGVVVIDPNDHPAEKTGAIPVGFTNKSIRAARDDARAAGKIPVLLADMQTIMNMVASAQIFIASLETTEPAIWAAFQPDGGESEVSFIFDDDGTLCRMRPDRISKDRKLIVDVKTSAMSVEPDHFGRSLMPDYRISASFYRRGCLALFDTTPDYVFLCIEQNAPHLCSLIGVPPAGYEIADEKVEYGLREWRRCVAANVWPAYEPRVYYVDPSPWEMAQWMERAEAAPVRGKVDYSLGEQA